jgi:hypothetical protein
MEDARRDAAAATAAVAQRDAAIEVAAAEHMAGHH